MQIKSIIVDDEKHGRENLLSRQTLKSAAIFAITGGILK